MLQDLECLFFLGPNGNGFTCQAFGHLPLSQQMENIWLLEAAYVPPKGEVARLVRDKLWYLWCAFSYVNFLILL